MDLKRGLNVWLSVIVLALLVLALSGCGGGSSTSPPPAAPTGVTAVAADSQATVSWTAVTGATSYNIYYGTAAGVTPATGTKVANATTPHAVTGLTNGTTYYFVITAVNGNGESVVSSAATALPLAVPTGVTAAAGDTQATISWSATPGATSYNIYWSTTAGVTTTTGTKVTGATSPQAITGLLDGTAYYFVVTAVYANGESVPSSEVTATPITRPSGMVASAENTQVTVAWPSVPGATSYNLYYGTTNPVTTANGTKVAVTAAAAGTTNGTPYFKQTVTGLTNGTTYYFAVTAVNAGGETVLSSQKSAAPSTTVKPGSPSAVTVTSTAAGQVHVVWGDYVPDATSYNIYYLQQSTAPTTSTVITTGTRVSLGTTSPVDLTSGFTSGLTYWFTVTSVDATSGQESGGQTTPKALVVQ